jgi:VWFA-related protein
MRLYLRPNRRVTFCILSLVTILLNRLPAFTQATEIEWSFPAQNSPRIWISNASLVSIVAWDKSEVSIKADVLATKIQAGEVKVKQENNRLIVSCVPAKPDRKIFLIVRAPAKSFLEIEINGNTVQVTQPADQIVISHASNELLQLGVPESSSLDMKEAPHAVERRPLGPLGNARIGLGGQRVGEGPPYVKVKAPKALVVVTRGVIESPQRPATLAASTIARRNGPMADALRRSAPQLIRPSARLDQTPAIKSEGNEEGALKLETHLVNLNVTATDRAGRAIPGLTRDDFSVCEDGVRQQISFFSTQQSPFNLVLLIDLSGSMKDEIDLIRETAIHFLEVISSVDSVAVVTFTTDVVVVSRLTRDREDLRDSINYMLAPAGGTAFYDALGYALIETLRKVKGQRNAVITITDGEDNALQSQLALRAVGASIAQGSFLTFEDLLDGATENDALIYPIHLNPAPSQPIITSNETAAPARQATVQIQTNTAQRKLSTAALTEVARKQLQSLADATGGRFYHANRIEDLRGVFEQVAAELRTVYSLAYTPTNLNFDGRFRRIRVQVNRPDDVAVRTRPGYYGR